MAETTTDAMDKIKALADQFNSGKGGVISIAWFKTICNAIVAIDERLKAVENR